MKISRMRHRALAVMASVSMLMGLGVATATIASAHTGDLGATAVCQANGTYLVTYKLTLANVTSGNTGTINWRVGGQSFTGTPSNANGMTLWGTHFENGTVTLGTSTRPGNATQADWAYAYTTFSPDGVKLGSDGGDITLSGDCKSTQPSPKTGQDKGSNEPVCVVPNNGQATVASWTQNWSQAYVFNTQTWTWVLGSKVYDAKVYTTTTIDQSSCIPNGPPVLSGSDSGNTPLVCVTPADGQQTTTPWTQAWTQTATWNADSHSWVYSDKVYADKVYGTPVLSDNGDCVPTAPPVLNGSDSGHAEPVCVTPLNGTSTTTSWTQAWTQGHVWNNDTHTWDLANKAYADKVYVTGEPVAQASCNPPPQVCVASGSWYTEDTAPTTTPDGLLFAGPSVPSVNWYHPLAGNLGGVGASITYTSVGGYHASLVFEIYRTGSTGYATINAEPYINGWAAGQTGTFTVDQSTLVWTSKIASGPGSQASPITLAAMGALYPTNTLISEGIHLGTNSVDGQHSLVSAVGGCVTANFVPPKATPVPPTVTQSVCTGPGTKSEPIVSTTDTAEIKYTYTAGSGFVTATPQGDYVLVVGDSGFELQKDGTATYKVDLTNPGDCLVPATPGTSLTQPVCPSNLGSITLDAVTGIEYSNGTKIVDAGVFKNLKPGDYTVIAHATDGYVLVVPKGWAYDQESQTATIVLTLNPSATPCATPTPTPPAPSVPLLPHTGGDISTIYIGIGGLLMLLLGGMALVFGRKPRGQH